jgi:nitrilase
MSQTSLTIGIAQIAPVLLDREATLAKVIDRVAEAASAGCGLVAFGETLVPGYPAWLCRVDGARFEEPELQELHALYLEQAVCLEEHDLESLTDAARRLGIAVVIGVAERPLDRGGHSLYCSRVFIDAHGDILSVHRKLMPTYEERLAWAIGDGAGLQVHRVGPFAVGALNCWENWMPLARTALYGLGEDLHVAIWPGGRRLTQDITRFIALESRSFVVSASGLMRPSDVPADFPLRDRFLAGAGELLYDGGSAVAAPDGSWVVEPVVGEERLIVVEFDRRQVLEARQSFDPSGHYARPDVLRLEVDRRRQRAVEVRDT